MATYQEAKEAKQAVKEFLKALQSCSVGVGFIGKREHCVQVNVEKLTDELRVLFPKEVLGVPVTLEEVGKITAKADLAINETYSCRICGCSDKRLCSCSGYEG